MAFEIGVGRRYRTRGGTETRVVEMHNLQEPPFYCDDGLRRYRDGRVGPKTHSSPADLMEEIIDEETPRLYTRIEDTGVRLHINPEPRISDYAPKDAKSMRIISDPVNHPAHYTGHPSGVECIQITEHMNFCIGNAIKYAWRADLKGNAIEDLEKAVWYLQREIARRTAGKGE